MALVVIAYPELLKHDLDKIQVYRKNYDELQFHFVSPHFTLVFPVPDISADSFVTEVKKQATGLTTIPFSGFNAVTNKDPFSDYYYCFLVPKGGYSEIVTLHDRLYSDVLNPYLRKDIAYVPHLTIGNNKDEMIIKKMANKWNERESSIAGSIGAIDICSFENSTVTTIDRVVLN
jgi:2'-5' RNA ligase